MAFTAALLLAAVASGAAAASPPPAAVVQPALSPRPSRRRYVRLDELASRLGAQVASDELTGVFRIQRGRLCAAVVPALEAVLIGSQLRLFETPVRVRYGRAYVPREAASQIERYLTGVARPPVRPPPPGPDYLTRVCVDPGHGGKDPGAPNRWGPAEKHIVLAVSRQLADELRRRGFEVVMTRQRDAFVDLDQRPVIAARRGAGVFVSVHANAINDPSIRGVEIFYCGGKYDPVARAVSAARAGRQPSAADIGNSPPLPSGVRQVVHAMLLEEYFRESRELARALQSSFASAGLHVRSVRSANYRVLVGAEMPAVLVELGFLTNRSESRQLQSPSHRRRLVEAIADGIQSYGHALKQTRGFSN